jgi:cyclopropane fatty-acyl-phospholipid synthase-like methyltransferase
LILVLSSGKKEKIMKTPYSRIILLFVIALSSITFFSSVSADPDKGLNGYLQSGRDEWQKPDEVVKNLDLKPGDVIADIGAGDGYFTRRFAKAVSPGGKALGLEISASKVESMTRDADRLGLDTYEAILVKSGDPQLEPGSVDVIFLCNAYHHIRNRVDYFKTVSSGLKENGRVVIVDFYKKEMPVGPPPGHTLARKVVLEEMEAAGYKILEEKDFLDFQYYLEFGLK